MAILRFSIPAILANLSSTVMQYIDAAMVGALGALASASVGLVASTTWLTGSLCLAVGMGFSVQVAHKVGAGDFPAAQSVVRHGLIAVALFGCILGAAGAFFADSLPILLGGAPDICPDAAIYFLIYSLALPIVALRYATAGMLQCSGNMRLPGLINILLCLLDVLFNRLFIFPTETISIAGCSFTVPGANLGVAGAALGTAAAEFAGASAMLYFLLFLSPMRKKRGKISHASWQNELTEAAKIAAPLGLEGIFMGGAQIIFTKIVAPLGNISLAANSFAITAEALCYMPGAGIASAATAIVGQCIGAKNAKAAAKMGWISVGLGMAIMGLMGILLYIFAPYMMSVLTADETIRLSGSEILRIEAFAEPLFGAAIVAAGVFRGTGKTIIPSLLTFICMWCVRLPLAYYLSLTSGLVGVWMAMCAELCLRGSLFLLMMGIKSNTMYRKDA